MKISFLKIKKAFLKLLKVVHPVTRLNVSSKQITTPSFFFILFLQIILLIAFSIFYRAAAAGFVLFLCFLIKFFLYNKTAFLWENSHLENLMPTSYTKIIPFSTCYCNIFFSYIWCLGSYGLASSCSATFTALRPCDPSADINRRTYARWISLQKSFSLI